MTIIYAAISVLFVTTFIAFYLLNKQKAEIKENKGAVKAVVADLNMAVRALDTRLEASRELSDTKMKVRDAEVSYIDKRLYKINLQLFALSNPFAKAAFTNDETNEEFTAHTQTDKIMLKYSGGKKEILPVEDFYQRWYSGAYKEVKND